MQNSPPPAEFPLLWFTMFGTYNSKPMVNYSYLSLQPTAPKVSRKFHLLFDIKILSFSASYI